MLNNNILLGMRHCDAFLEVLSPRSQPFEIPYTVAETKINRVRLYALVCTKSLSIKYTAKVLLLFRHTRPWTEFYT